MYAYAYAATKAPLRYCLPLAASPNMMDLCPYWCGAGDPRSVLNPAPHPKWCVEPCRIFLTDSKSADQP